MEKLKPELPEHAKKKFAPSKFTPNVYVFGKNDQYIQEESDLAFDFPTWSLVPQKQGSVTVSKWSNDIRSMMKPLNEDYVT